MSFRQTCLTILFALTLAGPCGLAQRLSPFAPPPEWSRLDAYQETMTREEFQRLLETVYAPGHAADGMIEVRDTEAVVLKTLTPPESYTLRFANKPSTAKVAKNSWRPAGKTGRARPGKPLSGVRIALDPGHIGGEWALMEERTFQRQGDKPVREGDMTLTVARLLARQLRAVGASVSFVRDRTAPSSRFTVEAMRGEARKELELLGVTEIRENYEGPRDPLKMNTVQWRAEKLFYRVAEIRERARKVNEVLRPDIVLCIHFNADDWIDPENPVFTDRNDLHVMLNGCYSAGELRYDDERLEMLLRLLSRSHVEELAVALPVARALAISTGLPPFTYITGNAVRVGPQEFVWARNLLANRLYDCPVIYLEPYRMNHAETYARIQAGDYDGLREVAGKRRPSIFREYADAVTSGLRTYYSAARRPAGTVPK